MSIHLSSIGIAATSSALTFSAISFAAASGCALLGNRCIKSDGKGEIFGGVVSYVAAAFFTLLGSYSLLGAAIGAGITVTASMGLVAGIATTAAGVGALGLILFALVKSSNLPGKPAKP